MNSQLKKILNRKSARIKYLEKQNQALREINIKQTVKIKNLERYIKDVQPNFNYELEYLQGVKNTLCAENKQLRDKLSVFSNDPEYKKLKGSNARLRKENGDYKRKIKEIGNKQIEQ